MAVETSAGELARRREPAGRGPRRLRGLAVPMPWGRLWVWHGGTGPPLLAIHGLGGSGRYWAQLARLAGDGFTVIAPDLAGFGRSDKPAVDYTRSFHLDNLDAAVRAVAGDTAPVLVAGHSLGGVLAALWTARHVPRVSGLALVATPFPATDLCMPDSYRRTEGADARRGRRRMYTAVQTLWPVLTFPVVSRVFPRAVIADYMRNTLQSYWSTARNVLWNPTTEAELAPLRTLTAPALLVNATDDRTVPMSNSSGWSALLPNAELRRTAGGHQLLLRNHFRDLTGWLDARRQD